jgi:hypothetical protein
VGTAVAESLGMRKVLAVLLFASACTTNVDGTSDDSDDLDADPVPGSPEAIAAAKITPIRGADRAEEIDTKAAKILLNDHGVKYYGVYIGGPCDGGSGWSKAGVVALSHATGWKFAPVYVGQQTSSICGAHNLTDAQGKADGKRAAADMKAFGWEPDRDIPVFLDLEAGTYFDHPSASTAYVRAWVNEVHAQGYRADVYSTPFGLNTFHDAHVKIDGVWAASYFYTGFANVVPADLDQMGSRYRHTNRSWQYAGGFEVSGVGSVDGDTANMLLAPKPGGTNRPTTSHREVPAACGALQPTEGLAVGESLSSCDGTAKLSLSTTGTLALAINGKTTWSVPAEDAATAVLEDNGELAIFDGDGDQLWAAGTGGYSDAAIQLTSGGLTLVDDDGTSLWSAATGMLVGDDDGLLPATNDVIDGAVR